MCLDNHTNPKVKDISDIKNILFFYFVMLLAHELIIEVIFVLGTAGAPRSEIAVLVCTKTWLCVPPPALR